jgi:hypothetical protein
MASYKGNTNTLVDWEEIISNLGSGEIRSPQSIWDNKSVKDGDPVAQEYLNILKTWIDAGYNIKNIYWVDFYPETDYSAHVDKLICQKLGIKLKRSWVSRVDPGRVAPWHYDVEDRMESWKKEGHVVRYTIFIDKPKWGSVFILEDTPFYNIPQGEIYLWDRPDQYHGAASCGGDSQFLYHLIGVKNG